ncbi:MAG: excinuclease ABC subunit UvrC [Gammaproteobacteria bacterium]|nr:excinuclease ABC subunit UvrC [Gammaproteobacteria bacterium]NIR85501.1 excinuclease ABC subunit UvrC [Gammaproteobacteria bacterium]NIR89553.1 excinuclease ABC subunit UvrC [Gammaproteobacteria bacterium]NIU06638.1 excinuclease ABC subunit UvrC [Gammaproteobacteria bacterium]NIV53521.1 excinuclease ABC subunit UvrC [Gammaproteobacteria bacterium]
MDVAHPEFDIERFLQSLPGKPGVYRLLDERGQVLYVGKARNLKRRVASYFRGRGHLDGKTRALLSHTRSAEVTVTHTETEALLLENNLIKEFRPRYNILLRDDKSYPYIYVSTEQYFPRLAFHRGPRRERGRYFGPYASAGATRETLSQLQKLFQIRQCDDSFFNNRSRPCLQYQIKRCTAPCVGYVEAPRYAEDVRHAIMFLEGKSEEVIAELVSRMESASRALDFELGARYRDQIASLRRVQERQYVSGARGDIDVVAVRSREGMGVVQVFFIRDGQNLGQKTIVPRQIADADESDILAAFLPQYYLTASSDRPVPAEILVSERLAEVTLLEKVLSERAERKVSIVHQVRGERARWLDMARANADLALAQRLADRTSLRQRFDAVQDVLELDESPGRIECFDVSHTHGEAPVASCVVFGPEGPLKSDYRRFNIRDVQPGDDYGAMRQALQRRYTRVKKEEGKLPDVLLIDGGKGQLAQATEVLHELQVTGICVVGVAKGPARKPGLESLFLPGAERPLVLPPDSPALHLVQQVRDEAHRFAVTGHRTRRTRSRGTSPLERIPGIGAKRRQRLLREFGGLQGVARAGVEDLAQVQGISRELARTIYESFREGA